MAMVYPDGKDWQTEGVASSRALGIVIIASVVIFVVLLALLVTR